MPCRSNWNDVADRHDRQPLLERLEHLEIVTHHEVGLAGKQQLHAVDLRPAHLDGDVEPGLLVEPGRLGLVEAAMLGLREPAGEEGDLVGGMNRRRKQDSTHSDRGCDRLCMCPHG